MVDMDDVVDNGVDGAAEMESLDLGSATVNDCDKLVEGRRCDGGWGGGGGGGGGGTVDVTGVPRDANSVCRCLRGVGVAAERLLLLLALWWYLQRIRERRKRENVEPRRESRMRSDEFWQAVGFVLH